MTGVRVSGLGRSPSAAFCGCSLRRIGMLVGVWAGALALQSPAHADLLNDLSYNNNRFVDVDPLIRDGERGISLGGDPGERGFLGGTFLGSFIVETDLELNTTFDDNILLTENNEVSDIVYQVAPLVGISSDWERHEVRMGGVLRSHFYNENTSENYENWNLTLDGDLDITDNWQLTLGTVREQAHTTRLTVLETIQDPRVRIEKKLYRADLKFKKDVLPYNGRVSVESRNLDYYPTAAQNTNSFDRTETMLDMQVTYALDPDLMLYVQPTFTDIAYDHTGNNGETKDAFIYEFLTGVEVKREGLWRANVGLGLTRITRESNTIRDQNGSLMIASFLWTPLPHFSANTTFFRQLQIVDHTLSLNMVQTGIKARLRYLMTDNVLLQMRGGFDNIEFEGTRRKDNNMYAALGGEYILNEHLRLMSEYRFISRDSSVAGESFDNNLLRFGVGMGL